MSTVQRTWRIMLGTVLTALAVGCTFHPQASAAAGLRVSHEQLVLIPVPVHNTFQVVEALDVVNPGKADADVKVALPSGYTTLTANGQPVKAASDGTVVFPHAAKAGSTTTVSVAYTLPFNKEGTAQFTLHSPYDVDTAQLYLPKSNYALTAQDLLTTTQTTELQGTEVRVFTRLGIPSGDDWTISLQQLPSATPADASSGLPVIGRALTERQNMLQAGANLVMAGVVLVIGLLGIRSTQGGLGKPSASREEALFRALENVEFQFAAGAVDEATYSRRKADVLSRLSKLKSTQAPGKGQ